MLGVWGSQNAKTAYARFVAELHNHTLGIKPPFGIKSQTDVDDNDVLISELAAKFMVDIESTKDKTTIYHFKSVTC